MKDLPKLLDALRVRYSDAIYDKSPRLVWHFENDIAALREALAEQQEPCGWQFYQDGKWHNGMETNNHRANTEAAGVAVRDVYPSPQPAQQQEPVTNQQHRENFEAWFR